MASITIRNLSAETHRALKIRAAQHGRSTEAEVREILERAALPEGRVRLGSLLAEIGRETRLTREEQAAFDAAIARDRTPAQPLDFDR
ncbi:plasmid stabilization protein [Rhodobacter sp. SGA-6-6]|uniref:FitA-like ribbon-helix-helix domain-containing protein n=1 Tax=Rhodobacter sp. SGA-6-6 TaxID=2710882 RepID=UPI0013EC95A8|nr:plasmid stabilization protein [Rhodobacter sp. SGA-6-6]NGM47783.1 plasmid stabilization protein [Rhodobacter sp. SGA-6-6]